MREPLPATPELRRDLRAECLPDALILIGEDERHIFRGRAFSAVAAQIDGRRSADEVARAVDPAIPATEIWYALGRLHMAGWIVPAQQSMQPSEAAWWDGSAISPDTATDRMSALQVRIDTLGPNTAALHRALAAAGIGTRIDGTGPTLRVVLTDDYLRDELDAIDAQQIANGEPWLLAKPVGAMLWLGPIIRPGATACWACLAERLRLNRQVEQFTLRQKQRSAPLPKSKASLPLTEALAANLLATHIALWVAGGASPIDGALMTFDTVATANRMHSVVHRPQCPACGDPYRFRVAQPVTIGSVPTLAAVGGGHRSASAEQTFARFAHHISPITGVVTWLENHLEQVDGLIYSYTAGHNFVMGQDNLRWLQEGLRTRTGGKGVTEIQAKVSAIGEAIERYSGVQRGDEPVLRNTRRALGDSAIDLHACLNFSDAQYDGREAWNRAVPSIFHQIPNRLDDDLVIDWSPLWSLTGDCMRYAPAAFCWYGHAESREHYFCSGDTNGCAAGATAEEAILQAFLELVERDAVAIWWYNRVPRPGVDLPSFGLPYLSELKDYYTNIGREYWVLDITTDLGIPTFAAISRRTDQPVEDVVFGFGSHLDPAAALLRAVTEMNQFLPAVMRRDARGQTVYAWPEDDAIRWWKNETVERQPWLPPAGTLGARRLADFERFDDADIGVEVLNCVEICRRAGLEMLVLDQTRPDIGMHVFRVIVPGLRHFWRRLGPGRLYDVPVRLGWLDAPTSEADLNPISVFI